MSVVEIELEEIHFVLILVFILKPLKKSLKIIRFCIYLKVRLQEIDVVSELYLSAVDA